MKTLLSVFKNKFLTAFFSVLLLYINEYAHGVYMGQICLRVIKEIIKNSCFIKSVSNLLIVFLKYCYFFLAEEKIWQATTIYWYYWKWTPCISIRRRELATLLLGKWHWHNIGWWNGSWKNYSDYCVFVFFVQRSMLLI